MCIYCVIVYSLPAYVYSDVERTPTTTSGSECDVTN